MTQQKALDLFTIPAPRISWARYEQFQELHEFYGVEAVPNTLHIYSSSSSKISWSKWKMIL